MLARYGAALLRRRPSSAMYRSMRDALATWAVNADWAVEEAFAAPSCAAVWLFHVSFHPSTRASRFSPRLLASSMSSAVSRAVASAKVSCRVRETGGPGDGEGDGSGDASGDASGEASGEAAGDASGDAAGEGEAAALGSVSPTWRALGARKPRRRRRRFSAARVPAAEASNLSRRHDLLQNSSGQMPCRQEVLHHSSSIPFSMPTTERHWPSSSWWDPPDWTPSAVPPSCPCAALSVAICMAWQPLEHRSSGQ
mmetsp:Transcript_22163/g.53043  ORF Transcript_22163/g.53043 Transcript_22163/m.53043 type:complete len:254 (+) Transcript_22163:103-864(+)